MIRSSRNSSRPKWRKEDRPNSICTPSRCLAPRGPGSRRGGAHPTTAPLRRPYLSRNAAQEAFVYQIPPLKNESGHRANDWDVNKWLWSGRLRIAARGNALTIYLEDSENGTLFAACPVREPNTGPTSVESVTDSSRYFVLRIEDGKGHHQYIGMGFRERPDAYDFTATISDHWKCVRREREANELSEQFAQNPSAGPQLDLKLKEGEMLNIHIGSKTRNRTANRRPSGDPSTVEPLRALAPPPLPPPLPSPPAAGSTPPQNAPAPAPAPPAASRSADNESMPPGLVKINSEDFGDFETAESSGAEGGPAADGF